MSIRIHDSIETVPPEDWNRLAGTHIPFLRHEYFSALEVSGSLERASGWTPCYLTVAGSAGRIQGAVPLFEKTDSRGEFIFDWSWAAAMRHAGRRYYPKLVAAIPYTPVPGPRCLLAPGSPKGVAGELAEAARALARERDCSSLHWLFVTDAELETFKALHCMVRTGCDFVWYNRNYDGFEAWLSTLTARHRKKVRRERRRVREAGIECHWRKGSELSDSEIDVIYELYASTYYNHGMLPYLTRDFFSQLAGRLPRALRICLATRTGNILACAVFLQNGTTLYGRYWGAFEWVNSLHFELCYYQGVAYAIDNRLQVFHPGAQGEHKLLRGFEPTRHYSAHWVADRDLARAVAGFLEQERGLVDDYMNAAESFLPYHHDKG